MNDSAELVLDGSGPIWRQIERQIRRLILCRELMPGDELPSVRALAVALVVSPRAVERAYNRLERAALVTRADGSAPLVAVPSGSPEEADLWRLCEMFLRGAARRGHSRAAVLHAFQTYLEREVPS